MAQCHAKSEDLHTSILKKKPSLSLLFNSSLHTHNDYRNPTVHAPRVNNKHQTHSVDRIFLHRTGRGGDLPPLHGCLPPPLQTVCFMLLYIYVIKRPTSNDFQSDPMLTCLWDLKRAFQSIFLPPPLRKISRKNPGKVCNMPQISYMYAMYQSDYCSTAWDYVQDSCGHITTSTEQLANMHTSNKFSCILPLLTVLTRRAGWRQWKLHLSSTRVLEKHREWLMTGNVLNRHTAQVMSDTFHIRDGTHKSLDSRYLV